MLPVTVLCGSWCAGADKPGCRVHGDLVQAVLEISQWCCMMFWLGESSSLHHKVSVPPWALWTSHPTPGPSAPGCAQLGCKGWITKKMPRCFLGGEHRLERKFQLFREQCRNVFWWFSSEIERKTKSSPQSLGRFFFDDPCLQPQRKRYTCCGLLAVV